MFIPTNEDQHKLSHVRNCTQDMKTQILQALVYFTINAYIYTYKHLNNRHTHTLIFTTSWAMHILTYIAIISNSLSKKSHTHPSMSIILVLLHILKQSKFEAHIGANSNARLQQTLNMYSCPILSSLVQNLGYPKEYFTCAC